MSKGLRQLVAPLLVAVLLAPLVVALAASLGGESASGYGAWWGTGRGWRALGATVLLAGAAATLALVWAALVVAPAARLGPRGVRVAVLGACLPLLMPSSLLGTAWIMALGNEGVLTPAWRALTGSTGGPIYSRGGAAAALALRYFGVAVVLLLHERLRQARTAAVERLFALPPGRVWWTLRCLPALRPALLAWLLVLLLAMQDHILPGMLLVSTYGTQVLIQYSALLDPSGAAALAAPVAGAGAVLLGLAAVAGRAWRPRDAGALGAPAPLGRPWRAGATAVLAVGLGVPVAWPAALLAWRCGSWSAAGDALLAARRELGHTLYLAALTGPLCAAGGALLARRWRSSAGGAARWLPVALALNLAVPASLLAIGVIGLFERWPLEALRSGDGPLLLAYAARFAPLAALVLLVAERRASPVPELAAGLHGVRGWHLVRGVLWPQRRALLVAVALFCALLAATELEMSVLLAPPGRSTLGVRLYTLIHTAPDALVSALALDMLVLVVLGIGLLSAAVRAGRAAGLAPTVTNHRCANG